MITRIAVPTDDRISISGHFGKSAAFLVFDIEDGHIGDSEVRPNPRTASAQGQCVAFGNHDHSHHSDHEKNRTHTDVLSLLEDCNVVLYRGMGVRAAEALRKKGIKPLAVGEIATVRAAVETYLKDALAKNADSLCHCHG
jgi:predicted Fe-Mo cluster-binding NifX family protein